MKTSTTHGRAGSDTPTSLLGKSMQPVELQVPPVIVKLLADFTVSLRNTADIELAQQVKLKYASFEVLPPDSAPLLSPACIRSPVSITSDESIPIEDKLESLLKDLARKESPALQHLYCFIHHDPLIGAVAPNEETFSLQVNAAPIAKNLFESFLQCAERRSCVMEEFLSDQIVEKGLKNADSLSIEDLAKLIPACRAIVDAVTLKFDYIPFSLGRTCLKAIRKWREESFQHALSTASQRAKTLPTLSNLA